LECLEAGVQSDVTESEFAKDKLSDDIRRSSLKWAKHPIPDVPISLNRSGHGPLDSKSQ
jgi:hypothetical protein